MMSNSIIRSFVHCFRKPILLVPVVLCICFCNSKTIFAQSLICGAEDGDPVQNASASSGILTDAEIINVGINYIIVKDSLTGAFPTNTIDLQAEIDYANSKYIDAKVRFYLCQTTVISSAKYNLFNSQDDIAALYYKFVGNSSNLYAKEHKINVYHVNKINNGSFSGFARFPWSSAPNNVILLASEADPGPWTLAHELGHFFGLPHTFLGSIAGIDRIPYVNQPDLSFVTQNGITYVLGDGISDTPSDPNEICIAVNNCAVSCDRGDLSSPSVPYDVATQPSNIMSYRCKKTFSLGQLEVIRKDAVAGRYAVTLHPNANESCTDIGLINRYCSTSNGPERLPIKSAIVNVTNTNPSGSCSKVTDADGKYSTTNCIAIGTTQMANNAPAKTGSGSLYKSDNGVTTADLVDIRKHILQLTLLDNPFYWLAADANYDGRITTSDFINIRQVLLRLPGEENFDVAGSWRFVPEWYQAESNFNGSFEDVTTDPSGPFNALWNENQSTSRAYKANSSTGQKSYMDYFEISGRNTAVSDEQTWSFAAVKTGDVDCSAKVDEFQNEDDQRLAITITPHACILAGDTGTFSLKATVNNSIIGYQTQLDLHNLATPVGLPSGDGSPIEIFNVNAGQISGNPTDFFTVLSANSSTSLRASWVHDSLFNTNLATGLSILQFDVKTDQDLCDISQVLSANGSLATQLYNTSGRIASANLVLERIDAENRSSKNMSKDYRVQAYPSPFSDALNFSFQCNEAQTVDIYLYNSIGQQIAFVQKQCVIGLNLLTYNDLGKLPIGPIHYKLLMGSRHFSGSIIHE